MARAVVGWQGDKRWVSEHGPDETDLTWQCQQRGPSTAPGLMHAKYLALLISFKREPVLYLGSLAF